jgi:prepilin-type N-terminal cleavage/methylation domain-containing protein
MNHLPMNLDIKKTDIKNKNKISPKNQQGFTLIELMIALVISMILMVGVTTLYSTIKGVIQTSKNIENGLEVIRFTSQVFTRSLKQTFTIPTISAGGAQISIDQSANTIACNGTSPVLDYTEIYTKVVDDITLTCALTVGGIAADPQIILTRVEDISFSWLTNQAGDNRVVRITVTPEAQPGETDGEGPAAPMDIDIALTRTILTNAL